MNPYLFTATLLLLSCGLHSNNSDEPAAPKAIGWRSAGLEFPNADDFNDGGGAQRMAHVGEHLFVMDAFMPRWADPMVEPEKVHHWRLWQGKVGSMDWVLLPLPDGEVVNRILAWENTLVVGTKYTGRVFRFDPDKKEWSKMQIPPLPDNPENYGVVELLGLFKGQLVVGVLNYLSNQHIFWMSNEEKGEILPGIRGSAPLSDIIEHNGYIYGMRSQHGLFRWRPGMDSLEALPSPRGRTRTGEDEYISALGVHQGKLLAGYSDYEDGLFRMEDDGSWVSITPLHSSYPIRDAPRDIRVILSYQDRLFIAGVSGSSPFMWVPKDSSCPDFGDWKLVDNGGCQGQEGCGRMISTQTWGMMGIGDTLYWSWWNYVLKIPISELDTLARPIYMDATMKEHVSLCPGKGSK